MWNRAKLASTCHQLICWYYPYIRTLRQEYANSNLFHIMSPKREYYRWSSRNCELKYRAAWSIQPATPIWVELQMKTYNFLFWVCYIGVNAVIAYNLILSLFFANYFSVPIFFFQVIFIGFPAISYIRNKKCNNCGKRIFVRDNPNGMPDFSVKFSMLFPKFPPRQCPNCHATIE